MDSESLQKASPVSTAQEVVPPRMPGSDGTEDGPTHVLNLEPPKRGSSSMPVSYGIIANCFSSLYGAM